MCSNCVNAQTCAHACAHPFQIDPVALKNKQPANFCDGCNHYVYGVI